MLTILSVAIGLILVLLLMSILSSTVHDIIASVLSLKAKHLKSTLNGMLGKHCTDFFQHPFFQQLTYADHRQKGDYRLPDWINKETFSAVLHDILQSEHTGTNLAEKIQSIEDPKLRRLLEYLVRESDGTIGGLKAKMEVWFDEVMERSSAYFARATKWRLFFIGLALSAILNADSIHIYRALSADPELREKMVAAAERIAAADTLPVVARDSSLKVYIQNTQAFLGKELNGLDSSLGLGWQQPASDNSIPGWLVKLAGFLLTGIAVTFGATFWFDLLKKLLSLRNSAGGSGDNSADTPSNRASRSMGRPPLQDQNSEPIGTLQPTTSPNQK